MATIKLKLSSTATIYSRTAADFLTEIADAQVDQSWDLADGLRDTLFAECHAMNDVEEHVRGLGRGAEES